jgi:DNA-binding NarL/FixJ family response regulator
LVTTCKVRCAALPSPHFSATIRSDMTRTVLIVDDHPSFRASARAVLESDEFEVVGEADDGASALAAVRSLRPDVILLDVQLPDMQGFDVCNELERDNGWRPSIVLVSSRDMDDYGDLIAASCAAGFLPKAELTPEALGAFLT